ncbi:hypothetical protein [Megalodesulfovibrio gigas]|uniref:Uncharacterized protein n=1 Tax=Megalodesulfovibrio gigas (strain ATCC 19364 / DSM 1382 / NCIMB 9332 / VKM B-1759) TaxID=1121448 RepID=T2G911_MEGG1|nr:hypothetical protein [Megalodesulfovibrio gigas]AGW12601.1 hypothetical protein DGI_0697 [Megalodesulfovibrio gigas DSM 1382 = ATCC 19364]
MQYDQADAVQKLSGVMKFESWIRFYFITEEEDALFIRIPDAAIAKMQELYPEHMELVNLLNNETITYEKSVNMVCQHMISHYDGVMFPTGKVMEVMDTNAFQIEMQLFHVWTQHHEEQLDQGMLDFAKWMELYEEWKRSAPVQEFVNKLNQAPMPTISCSTDTMH